MAEPNTLYVQMFGNFRMKYGEKPLTGEKIRDTYFTSLMQILLHNVPGGVSRDYLEDVLFSGGLVRGEGKAVLYVGVSDCEIQYMVVPDPFSGV